MKYLSEEDCEVAILREPFNKSNKFSIVILFSGHGQVGKTSALWYYANRVCQLRKYGYAALDPLAHCNKWDEWDGFNLTALSAQDFVRLWNNNKNAVLALAEASTQLYYMDWMRAMSRVFNSTTTVLGKQRNICLMDTVMESELMQKARDKIDFRIEVHDRNDEKRMCHVRSGWSLVDYLGMKWMLIRNNTWDLYYTKRMLLKAQQYTDWISGTLKQDEMEENERRVGLRPTVEQLTMAQEAADDQKWINEQKSKPYISTDTPGI